MVGKGVMGAPGQIDGNPVSQCGPRRPQRSTNHGKRAADKLPGPGQAETEQGLALQRPAQKGVDILRCMYAKNIFEGYRLRLNDFLWREDALGQQPFRNQAILVHGIGVITHGCDVASRGKGLHPHSLKTAFSNA